MTALNNLLFRVSLLDGMSGPARTMMNNMDRVTSRIQGGFNKIAYGAGGLAGAAYSLDGILQPAKDMNKALGEISSMSVAQDVLDNLNKTALKFSVQFGESAAEFVSSAYDIQGAISGLVGNELPAFTYASDVLAKGTKADMATITNYVGTMYGIFHDKADAMGKANWINMMASQTAVAVNIFKSTGQGMSDAFENLGARAATANIAMEEQMAILGSLQATMKGAEAGTGYRSFLDKVVKSQKDLNLSFLDSHNHMLPMVDILTKIKGKYGDLSDQKQMAIVSKAFGESPEAMRVITALIGDIDGLSASIAQVGEQTGLQGAIDMAKAMTMPWEQAGKAVDAVRIMLGQKMLPVMTPVYNGITGISEKLMRWMDLFPHITTYIGYAVFAVLGIIAALSLLSIMVGVGMVSTVGFGLAWSAVGVILAPLTPLITALRMAWAVMKMEILAGSGVFTVLNAGLVAFGTQLKTNIAAVWAWNVALFSNPVTWIVLGIGLLIGLVAAAVIYWDTWTQAVANWFSAFDPFYLIGQGIGWIIVGFQSIGQAIDWLIAGFQAIPDWWNGFKAWVSTLNPLAAISEGIALFITGLEAIPQWWTRFKAWLASLNPFAGVGSALYNLMSGIQSVTGSDIPTAMARPDTVAQSPALAKLTAPAAIARPGPAIQQPPVLVKLDTPAAISQPTPTAQAPVLVKLETPAAIAQPQTVAPSLAAMTAQPQWLQQPAPGLLSDGFAQPQPIAPPAALSQSQTANVPKGGIMSQINNANNSKSIDVGGIYITNPQEKVSGQLLADQLLMSAG